jgi:mRNA interferase HigB
VRVVALSRLREFWEAVHADAEGSLRAWYRTCERAEWSCFADVKHHFGSADIIGDKAVFNILGNRYRLVAAIDFVRKGVLVKWIGTHVEYDRLEVSEL